MKEERIGADGAGWRGKKMIEKEEGEWGRGRNNGLDGRKMEDIIGRLGENGVEYRIYGIFFRGRVTSSHAQSYCSKRDVE